MASYKKEGYIIAATDAETKAHSTEQQDEENGGNKSLSTAHIFLVLLSLYNISAASSPGTRSVTIRIPHNARALTTRQSTICGT